MQADALASMGMMDDVPYEEVVSALTRAVELAESAGLLAQAARAHANLGVALMDPEAAREHALRAAELHRQRGDVSAELFSRCNVARESLLLGDLSAAEEAFPLLQELADAVQEPGFMMPTYLALLELTLLYYRGELAEAIEGMRSLRGKAGQRDDLFHYDWLTWQLAGIFVVEQLGEEEEVEAILQELVDLGAQGRVSELSALCLLSVQRARQGEFKTARALVTAAQEKAAEQVESVWHWLPPYADAHLALAEGHWPEALAAFEVTVDMLGQGNWRWHRARTLVDWAEAHLARGEPGDRERGLELLREAEAEFEAMGADGYVERVRGRLEELG